jgi:alkylhydroperoxidase/carboxymuconolactone decarboxylase family protein YurZ
MSEPESSCGADDLWLQLARAEEDTVSDAASGLVAFPRLDARTRALTRLACAIALPLDAATFRGLFDNCLAAGVEASDVRDIIDAVRPVVGAVRTKEAVAYLNEVLATS